MWRTFLDHAEMSEGVGLYVNARVHFVDMDCDSVVGIAAVLGKNTS